jgi:hypothetical protein
VQVRGRALAPPLCLAPTGNGLSRGCPTRRPLSAQEIADRTPAVVSCNEALREVTLYQFAAGKQLSRTFHFDKVRIAGAALRARRPPRREP